MPKSLTDLKSVDKLLDEAVEMFEATAEVKGEIANDVLAAQDDKTKAVILKIAGVLRSRLSDSIKVKVGKTSLDVMASGKAVEFAVVWTACEIAKDLALVGIRVGSFVFPADTCAVCGGDV